MPVAKTILLDHLQALYPPASTNFGQLCLINDVPLSHSFTSADVDSATGTFTIPSHGYSDAGDGTRVRFTDSAPGGLNLNQDYWVRNVSGGNFKVSATAGGSAISSFSTAGTGTMIIADQQLDASDQTVAQWIRKEAVYQGDGRQSFSTPTSPSYVTTLVSGLWRATFPVIANWDNTSPSLTVTFNKILLLTGGSLTTGNTTGTFNRFWAYSDAIAPNTSRLYTLDLLLSN